MFKNQLDAKNRVRFVEKQLDSSFTSTKKH